MVVSSWEGRIFADLLKDLEHAWVSGFDVVFNSTVVRVDPGVAVRVNVYNEF
jgi:hypothetical protein